MHPFLPKLKDDEGNIVTVFRDSGKWDSRDALELDRVSQSLDVKDIDPVYFDIDCIPSMWARPLLFDMALYDPKHLLHRRILGEWRGLLAILALKEWLGLNQLEVVPVQIPKPDEGVGSPEFLKALGKLAPNASLSDDTTWHKLYVILFNQEAIGVTSPTTLVCTAADYRDRIKNVPWFDGRFLYDPTPNLGTQERGALSAWLGLLGDNLSKHNNINVPMLNKFLVLISEFQDALGVVSASDINLNDRAFTTSEGVFLYLKPIVPVAGGIKESHVLLSPRDKSISPLLLVVDRDIPGQWGMPDSEVRVWGPTSIALFPFNNLGGSSTMIGTTQLPQNIQWRLAEAFFTDKLFIIDSPNAFPGAMSPDSANLLTYDGKRITPVIPIKDELLNYLTIDNLRDRIVFEQSHRGGIAINLWLPLSGPDGQGKDFCIKREYGSPEHPVIQVTDIPVLEVWPNLKAPGWKAYYTYYSPAGYTTFYATPYTLGGESFTQVFEREGETTWTSLFPEAMKCQYEGEGVGVLLLTQPDPKTHLEGTWDIGVDFGTTATNVYVYNRRADPFPVTFHKRSLQVTESGAQRTTMYLNFLPGEIEKTPFLSLFHDLRSRGPQQERLSLRPLLDGHIYFLLNIQAFDPADPAMKIDLKWSDDPGVRMRAQAFLEQLCLQCAAEAVDAGTGRIQWKFSYPTAFSTGDQQQFRTIWSRITQICAQVTGVALGDAARPDDAVKDEPESIVAARFFHGVVRAPFSTGTVCIDMGGGTSDISIWQKNFLLWQTSLRFAGRELFLNLLYKRPDFLRIFNVDVESLNRYGGNRPAFYAQADALIARDGQSWLNGLPILAGRPEVKGFVQLIAIGISGLYYYIGLMLRYLYENSIYTPRMPDVYVGGNGARIFHWLAVGHYDFRSPINNLFKAVLLKASGFQLSDREQAIKMTISPNPKAEAAYGLVYNGSNLQSTQSTIMDRVLAGETFEENGQPRDWSEMLVAERFAEGLKALEDLKIFNDFMDTFDKYATSPISVVSPISPNDVLRDRIYQLLDGALADRRGVDPKIIHVEPLFIAELKALLEVKTDEWV